MERELARIAEEAHGLVRRADLVRAGVTLGELKQRLRTGALLREYRGVYRVGHRAPSLEADYLAAVWACGDGSLLSGRAAGHLLGLLKGAPPRPEVTAPTERRVKGVVTHRRRHMDPRDAMVWNRIPVTTVPCTLVGLAAELALDDLARACHEAGVRHRTIPADVEVVLARRQPNLPGAANLRQILVRGVRVTLSEMERCFLARLRDGGLPLPETNRPARGRRVNCRWVHWKLTVELDSYQFHHSRYAWEQDRRREREARARGDEFRRFTYGDVCEDSRYMMRELRALLSLHRPG